MATIESSGVDPDDDDKPTEPVVIHVCPSYPPDCKHEWIYEDAWAESPSHCGKCGMSWTRYIFTECP